jgi:hypothetical protein
MGATKEKMSSEQAGYFINATFTQIVKKERNKQKKGGTNERTINASSTESGPDRHAERLDLSSPRHVTSLDRGICRACCRDPAPVPGRIRRDRRIRRDHDRRILRDRRILPGRDRRRRNQAGRRILLRDPHGI